MTSDFIPTHSARRPGFIVSQTFGGFRNSEDYASAKNNYHRSCDHHPGITDRMFERMDQTVRPDKQETIIQRLTIINYPIELSFKLKGPAPVPFRLYKLIFALLHGTEVYRTGINSV
jgi:hypothetical protein